MSPLFPPLPSRHWSVAVALGLAFAPSLSLSPTSLWAQPGAGGRDSAQTAPGNDLGLPVAAAGDQVVIKRDGIRLIDPEKYRVTVSLRSHQQVVLSAPADGVVKDVTAKLATKLSAQSEILRLENTAPKLQLDRAKALYRVATLEQKGADGGDENAKAIAQARVEAAKAELDLAQQRFDQATVRAPFDGEVQRLLVVPGQYVRAGDPLAVFGDNSKLTVEIPAERTAVAKDQPYTIRVESQETAAQVQSVVPLNPQFDALRDLFDSVTGAVLVLDNADGKWKPGMTVFAPIAPRQPITEVATSAVGNTGTGERKVQVVRQNVVRDIIVQAHGSVGPGRLFVSGPFQPGDEVIYQTSHQLADGFQVRPAAAAGPAAGTAKTPGAAPATPATRPSPVGF